MYRKREGHYRISQICTNGHIISSTLESVKEAKEKFCSECGAPTITRCQNPKCKQPIQGDYYNPYATVIGTFLPPNFCNRCGRAYPWTESAVNAAKELANELSKLNEKEKETLKQSIDDIIRDTPRTTLAITRFKKLAPKFGAEASNVFKSILAGIATQAAKQEIWGNTPAPS